MNPSIKRFLDFNGKRVYFLAADGQWWIAIKPICESLGVKYEHQFEVIKKNHILGQLFRIHGMVAADGRNRKMVCLPEFAVYGWLFKLNSAAKGFEEYQWKCYELLYSHFHGMITLRNELLQERAVCLREAEQLRQELRSNPAYVRLIELDGRAARADKAVRKAYKEIIDGQTSLWDNN